MARIPLYTGRGGAPMQQLTSGPSVNYSKIKTFDAKAFTAVGSQITNVFEKMNNERIRTTVNNASADAQLKLAQLQTEMQNIDPSQVDVVYGQRAQQIYQEATQNMDSQAVSKFHTPWIKMFSAGRVSNYKQGIRRGRDVMLGDFEKSQEKRLDSYTKTTTAVEFASSLEEHNKAMDQLIGAGVVSASKGEENKQQFLSITRETQASYSLINDPVKFSKIILDQKQFEGLDPLKRKQLYAKSLKEIERREKEAVRDTKVAATEAERKVQARLIFVRNDGKGIETNFPEFSPENLALIPSDKRKIYEEEIAFYKFEKPNIDIMSNAELSQQTRQFAEQSQQPTGDAQADASRLKRAQLLAKAAADEIKARTNTHSTLNAASVVQRDPAVSAAFAQYTTAIQSNDTATAQTAWSRYTALANYQAEELGIPATQRQFLTKNQREQFAVQMQEGGADAVSQFAKQIHGTMSNEHATTFFSEVFKDGKMSDNFTALASIENDSTRANVTRLLKNGGLTEENIGVKPTKLKGEANRVFDAKFNIGFRTRMSLIPLRQSVLLAAGYYSGTGDSPAEAVDKAMREVANYQVIDRQFVKGIVPKDGDNNVVQPLETERALRTWLTTNAKTIDFMTGPTSGLFVPENLKDDEKILFARAIESTAMFKLSGDGKTATLVDRRGEVAILDSEEKRIVVDVEQAIQDDKANLVTGPEIRKEPGKYPYAVLRSPDIKRRIK